MKKFFSHSTSGILYIEIIEYLKRILYPHAGQCTSSEHDIKVSCFNDIF